MRVLVFGMSADKFGGIESFLLNMNRHMNGECIFDYVIVGKSCIYEDKVKAGGGKVFYTTPYSQNPFKHLKELRQIVKECRDTHKTAYFNLFSMVHLIPVMLCERYGYKIVFHSHNSSIPKRGAIDPYRLLHAIGRKLYGGKKNITRLTCAPKAAEFMFGKGKNRSARMIYNAIEPDRFRFSPEARESIKNELGFSGKKVIGFAGRLEQQKNPLFLIDIFEEIAKKDDACRFLILGDGSMRPAIEEAILKKGLGDLVCLLQPRPDIEKFYSAMDLFLLPSLFEGLPVVLVETQANGLLSLVSSEAVPREAEVREGFIIFCDHKSSAKDWANAAICALDMRRDRYEWNDAVKKSHFDIDTEAGKLKEVLS